MLKNSYVILIPSLSRGGAESMAYQYGKFLEYKGHQVKFLLIENRIDKKYSDVDVIIVESKSITSSIKNMAKLTFDKKTIFISLIPYFTFAFMLSRFIRLDFKLKYIFTVHNNIKHDFGTSKIGAILAYLYVNKLKKSNNVYGVSKELNNNLYDLGIKSNLLLNKVSHKFKFVNRKTTKILSFLMVGRIDEQKDYIKSLEFFKILNENKIKFTVDIYGEGPVKLNLLKKINAYGLSDFINLHGYCHNIEEVMAKQNFDILFLSSRYEGFGLVLVEAISKCMFVISRDCDFGPREIITKEVGHLIPFNFQKTDVIESINYFNSWNKLDDSIKRTAFEERYKLIQQKSEKTWKNLELHQ